MPEEMKPYPTGKSTRSFEEWESSLLKIVAKYEASNRNENLIATIVDEKVKPYYDQGLMPTVAFNELFNR